MSRIVVGALCSVLALAACTGGGPRMSAILSDDNMQALSIEEEAQPYVLVELSTTMSELVSSATAKTTRGFFADAGRQAVTIGTGDVLDISIVLTSENGFIDFTQSQVSPVSTTVLPPQEVASDGNVNVPPVGRVLARGKTVQQFENFLARRLGEVLVDPSVIVRLSDRKSARVSVLGNVGQPGPYSINLENQRLLETLALAGGPSGRAEHLTLSLSRKGATRTLPLEELYQRSAFNISLRPGDVIAVNENLTQVQVLGGLGVNGTLEFKEPEVSLADALARAGGLLNTRGNLKGVFVYREASRKTLGALGADLEAFSGDTVPTVFRLDMTEPTGFFSAGRFALQDNDILYVADSLNAEIRGIFGATTLLAPAPEAYVRDATIGN